MMTIFRFAFPWGLKRSTNDCSERRAQPINAREFMKDKKITVKYSAAGQIGEYGNDKEIIELSVEIDDFNDYPNTLELLRSRVLENLNLKEKHDKMQDEYEILAQKFLKLNQEMESAQKQWELMSNFLRAQGLKSDVAEFPQEALKYLSKSGRSESGYPK